MLNINYSLRATRDNDVTQTEKCATEELNRENKRAKREKEWKEEEKKT